MKKIYMLSAKAQSGKDTTAALIKQIYEEKGLKVINLQYGSYIKEYAKNICGWDGTENNKPRQLLNEIGTEVIRKKIDELFFVKRIIGDLIIYSHYFDIITISDVRFKVEIELPKEQFDNIIPIRIQRPNFDNGLTNEQKKYITETQLDDYDGFKYQLINDGDFKELENKVRDMINFFDSK